MMTAVGRNVVRVSAVLIVFSSALFHVRWGKRKRMALESCSEKKAETDVVGSEITSGLGRFNQDCSVSVIEPGLVLLRGFLSMEQQVSGSLIYLCLIVV